MIPQIFSVAPATGGTAGWERLVIEGYGFRVPDPEAFSAEQSPDNPEVREPVTVLVSIDGVACDYVAVLSDEEIVAATPRYLGDASALPKACDVVVTNLDDDGDPIPGETATRVGAYTFARPTIVDQGPTTWLTRQLIQDFKRNLCREVVTASSPDFSDDPLAGMVAVSSLPCIGLTGPEVTRSAYYDDGASELESGEAIGGGSEIVRPALIRDLAYGMIIFARSKTEAMNLQHAADHYFARRATLSAQEVPGGERHEFAWSIGTWRAVDRPADKVFTYESDLTIRGVSLGGDLGLDVDLLSQTIDDNDEALVLDASQLE